MAGNSTEVRVFAGDRSPGGANDGDLWISQNGIQQVNKGVWRSLGLMPGTVDAVGMSFGNDRTSGLYSIASGNPALAAGGVKVLDAQASVVSLPEKITFSDELVHTGAATITKSTSTTLTAAESGYVIYVNKDKVVLTLPATLPGLTYTIVNLGDDGAIGVTLSPAAVDKIQGIGLTAADDKDLINLRSTAKKGDLVQLVGDGLDGWFVVRAHGAWSREK